jgi:hypothetical protein
MQFYRSAAAVCHRDFNSLFLVAKADNLSGLFILLSQNTSFDKKVRRLSNIWILKKTTKVIYLTLSRSGTLLMPKKSITYLNRP